MCAKISPWVYPGLGIKTSGKIQILENMLDEVCNYYGVDKSEVTSETRRKRIKDVRYIFIIYAYTYTTFSYEDIGGIVNRDHSTAIYASKSYNNDSVMKREFDLFSKTCTREKMRVPLQ